MIGKRYRSLPLTPDPRRTRELARPQWLRVHDDELDVEVFGGRQQWFEEPYRQHRGCGPCTAALITAYIARQGQLVSLYLPYLERSRAQGIIRPDYVYEKSGFVQHMEALWNDLPPGLLGLFRAQHFVDGLKRYTRGHGVDLDVELHTIKWRQRRNRRNFRRLVQFISAGLEADIPVAWFNLSAGQASEVSSWHWATIVALEANQDLSQAEITIADVGVEKTLSLDRWFYTSRLGGSLVRCEHPRSRLAARG